MSMLRHVPVESWHEWLRSMGSKSLCSCRALKEVAEVGVRQASLGKEKLPTNWTRLQNYCLQDDLDKLVLGRGTYTAVPTSSG